MEVVPSRSALDSLEMHCHDMAIDDPYRGSQFANESSILLAVTFLYRTKNRSTYPPVISASWAGAMLWLNQT